MNTPTDLARSFWEKAKRLRPATRTPSPAEAATPLTQDAELALAQLDLIRDECRRLVTRRASMSAGASIVPLPGLDLGTDIAILLKLLPQINERFGLSPEQIAGLDLETQRIVMVLAGTVGSGLVGRLITRELVVRLLMKMGLRVTTKGVVKFVPLLGQAVSASISFGAMKLLGNRHIDDCYRIARGALLERYPSPSAPIAADGGWEVVR